MKTHHYYQREADRLAHCGLTQLVIAFVFAIACTVAVVNGIAWLAILCAVLATAAGFGGWVSMADAAILQRRADMTRFRARDHL